MTLFLRSAPLLIFTVLRIIDYVQEELEQAGHYDLSYQDLIHNAALLEVVPDLPSLVKDRSEMFLNAAGVAFTQVNIIIGYVFVLCTYISSVDKVFEILELRNYNLSCLITFNTPKSAQKKFT